MLAYIKSRNFPIHLLAYWWILWLALSRTNLNEFIPPSGATLAQYGLLIASFLIGHWIVAVCKEPRLDGARKGVTPAHPHDAGMRGTLRAAALLCAVMLLVSLWLAGAFSTSFIEYFAKLRMGEDDIDLTGIRSLDVLTNVFVFPLSYTVILVVLAGEPRRHRFALTLCILNLLAFSYLWQVNYPLIHLFWFLAFYWLVRAGRQGSFDKNITMVMGMIVVVLLASAANRFGGNYGEDILGVVQRYFLGYHLIGFSFYDHQYLDPNSILHAHSFGRSSLGFLDRVFQALAKLLGADYTAASLENTDYNSEAVDIGLREIRQFNAFGTIVFGLYRDFHLFGIVLGGLAYGAVTTRALHRGATHWQWGALFMLLASSWMMGMMVNPIERPYFWFAIVALAFLALTSPRGRRRLRERPWHHRGHAEPGPNSHYPGT